MSTEGITRVDFVIRDTAYWDDSLQFGEADDQTWNFTGMTFFMNVKKNRDDTVNVLTLSSGAGSIVVSDQVNRILNMFVSNTAIANAMTEGDYEYTLYMQTVSSGQIDPLCYGKIRVIHGI